jgi:hypothetical protein
VADITKEVEKRTCFYDILLRYMRKEVKKEHNYVMTCLHLGEVGEKKKFM